MNNILKRWAYNKFAKEDIEDASTDEKNIKKNKEDSKENLANPKFSTKLDPKKKKRLFTSLIVLAAVGVPLSLILYFNLRETEISIKVKYIADEADDVTNVKVTSTSGKEYVIAPNANAYAYLITNDYFRVYVSVNNESLPLTFSGYKITDGKDVSFKIGESIISPTPTTTTYNFLNGLVSNAVVQSAPFNWMSLISMLIPIAIIIVMIISFTKMSKMQGGGSGQDSIFGMGKSNAKVAKSDVKFDDVAGIQEEKNELIEVVDYLRKPQKYVEMGARTPKGVILYGPPGTGKTLLAKAVAGEAGVPFFQISGSQFEDMLVGVGAKRVRDLFSRARKVAPSIIFIDEIDSVASKRGKNEFGGGLADQTINQLLAEMDGFNTSTGIVVIAATNRLDVLDDAILRPGRFDRHIQVNLPDIKEREAILKIHSKNKNISSKVSFYDIARRTPGFSGAQLENVLNEATLLAVRNNQTIINEADIDEAIDRVIGGPAKKSKVISEGERKQIAYHEAGHALVGLHTPGTDVVQKITIIPRGNAAGYTMQTPEGPELSIQKKRDLLNNIRMTLGGRAAEEIIFGLDSISTGASNDLYKITNIVRAMVMQLGMTNVGMTQFISSEGSANPYSNQKLYSEHMAQKIDIEIEKIIQAEYTNAKKIITKNKKELDLIVETLLILETILKDQIDYIHKHKKLPSEAIAQKEKNKIEKNKESTNKNKKAKN